MKNLVRKPASEKVECIVSSIEHDIVRAVTNGKLICQSTQARVTPMYKTGSTTDVNNYRPISVLSAVSRILEKIIHDQLMEYLKGYNKLCLNHFAFQKLHNTVTCLLNIIDPWLKSSDEGKNELEYMP